MSHRARDVEATQLTQKVSRVSLHTQPLIENIGVVAQGLPHFGHPKNESPSHESVRWSPELLMLIRVLEMQSEDLGQQPVGQLYHP